MKLFAVLSGLSISTAFVSNVDAINAADRKIVTIPDDAVEAISTDIEASDEFIMTMDDSMSFDGSAEDFGDETPMLGNANIADLVNFMKSELEMHANNYVDYRGVAAVGYGKNIDERKKLGGLTNAEMNMLLENDIKRFEKQLTEKLPWYPSMPPPRRGALLSMAMQIGFPGILKFKKTLNAMEAKKWDRAASEMADSTWARQTPNRSKRLQKQVRTNEWQWKPGHPKAPTGAPFYTNMYFHFLGEEGAMSYLYKCSKGYYTVGIGRNVDRKGGRITEAEASTLLQNDVKTYIDGMNKSMSFWRKFDPVRQRAMVAIAHGFLSVDAMKAEDRFVSALEANNWEKAASALRSSALSRRSSSKARLYSNMLLGKSSTFSTFQAVEESAWAVPTAETEAEELRF